MNDDQQPTNEAAPSLSDAQLLADLKSQLTEIRKAQQIQAQQLRDMHDSMDRIERAIDVLAFG